MSNGASALWRRAITRLIERAAGSAVRHGWIARDPGRFVATWLATLVLAGALTGAAASAQQPNLSAKAEGRIGALLLDKAARTPAQGKLSSRLLHGVKRRQADALARSAGTSRSSVKVARDGTTLVDIDAEVSGALLSGIAAAGGRVVNSFPDYRAIRAHIPLDRLEEVARASEVISIRPADEMITNKADTSGGDVAHRAALARVEFGVDGSGIKICALSDGVASLAAVQASGDLPAVEVLSGQGGFGTEGTAMLEIVHDLAPGAQLGFATAIGGQAQFAQNILDLREVLGCDVIVDDVFYFAEPTFQDGIIAQAVDQVVADGAVYFSSAGNSGNLNDGTSGVWEGDYVASSAELTARDAGGAVVLAGSLHDFGGGATSNEVVRIAPSFVTLHWSDPLGGSDNDYDLCVLDATLTVVHECSTNFQTGSQDPFEMIGVAFPGERLVIVDFSGNATPRYLHLNTNRGRLAIATDGQTAGHAAAEGAFGVAAVNVAAAKGGPFAGGARNPVEPFSSDGPRRMFFDSDGKPITRGNFTSTGGEVRHKPDVAAADGVATATPGFGPFFGTSAAAPHAAAIAGLMLSSNFDLDADDVRDVFFATAVDTEARGVDRDSGVGIVDAYAALDSLSVRRVLVERAIGSDWRRIALREKFRRPVVIVGPPSSSNKQPGVVALRRVGRGGFQARFREWRYLDGKHKDERAAFLVVEQGRRKQPDGSILEAGALRLRGTGKWRRRQFTKRFPGTPEVFLTVQTSRNKAPVVARARKVSRNGFEVALLEEERDLGTGHPGEKVGYLAVYSPKPKGMISGSMPLHIGQVGLNHRFRTVLGTRLKLEEERSLDQETRHVREGVSAMTLGRGLFAQQVTGKERDPTAIRRR